MGWLQYSCPLWLSIGNIYILYTKAINCADAGVEANFSTVALKKEKEA
jgi:hypothetical protein